MSYFKNFSRIFDLLTEVNALLFTEILGKVHFFASKQQSVEDKSRESRTVRHVSRKRYGKRVSRSRAEISRLGDAFRRFLLETQNFGTKIPKSTAFRLHSPALARICLILPRFVSA